MFPQRSIYAAIFTIVLLTAAPAAAQWTVVPYAGAAFGGQLHDGARPTFGGSVGRTVNRWFGVEADAAWTSDPFRVDGISEPLFGTSAITTVMGNAVVAVPWRWGTARVRPFGVAGIGVMHTKIGDDDAFVRVSNTHAGITLGGGATVDIWKRVGIRADLRYLRDLQQLESDSEFFSLGDTRVTFWRSTAGLSIRF